LTRPRKQTVDYFPHDCNHGKTMFIIEQRYGNDGYAFWFKLLELLGKTQGHYIDISEISTLEFLASVTRIEPDICLEILNLLARLEAIDSELWESKVIWSDNFVSRITDVYRNRVLETPIRPDFLRKKPPIPGITDIENPQTKLKESKVNKTKLNDKTPRKVKNLETPLPDNFKISDAVLKWAEGKGFYRLEDHLDAFKEYALSRGKTYVDWDSAFKRAIREDWGKVRGNGQGQCLPSLPISKSEQVTLGNLAARDRLLKKYREQGE
jgi:hypothetical protein